MNTNTNPDPITTRKRRCPKKASLQSSPATTQAQKIEVFQPGMNLQGRYTLQLIHQQLFRASPVIPNNPVDSLFVASNGKQHLLISPILISNFLYSITSQGLVFQNAATEYWSLDEYFQDRKDQPALRHLQNLWRGLRIHDLCIMDYFLCLARGTLRSSKLRDSPEIIQEYQGSLKQSLDQNTLFSHPKSAALQTSLSHNSINNAVIQTSNLANTFNYLHRQGLLQIRGVRRQRTSNSDKLIHTNATQRFGSLTEALQTAASIAFARVEQNGFHINQKLWLHLYEDLQHSVEYVAQELSNQYPGLFKMAPNGDFERTATTQVPKHDKTELDQLFREARTDLLSSAPSSIRAPAPINGKLSHKKGVWQQCIPHHPFLKLWFQLQGYVQELEWLNKLRPHHQHSKYRVLSETGRAYSSKPNFQGIPKLESLRKLIVPSPGHLFLNVDYKYLELVALAATHEKWYGRSALADTIRQGIDPHCYTAAMLQEIPLQDFLNLEQSKPKRYRQWRGLAKVINFGVPVGMSPQTIIELAAEEHRLTLTLPQVESFLDDLILRVYPEWNEYLRYRGFSGDTAVTLNGRIRGGVTDSAQLNTPFQGLAADGLKLALIGLVSAGYRVVGVVHDEFLIEIPDEGGYVSKSKIARPLKIIRDEMQTLMGNVPVDFKYTVSTCWSPAAKLQEDAGVVRAWNPSHRKCT